MPTVSDVQQAKALRRLLLTAGATSAFTHLLKKYMKKIVRATCLAAYFICIALVACGGGGGASESATAPSAAVTPGTGFALTSSAGAAGGLLPADYTCDGTSSSPPLAWANAPGGTKEFALLMTTVPVTGAVKYNWVLSGIPASASSLARNSSGVGTPGVGSDGPTAAYQAPCSQGPGQKVYTFTLYALSASPALAAAASTVTGDALASAIASVTLASTALDLNYTRGSTTVTGSAATNCQFVADSLAAFTTGQATSTCDGTFAYIASSGLATHAMMNGIVATNLQVPVAQNFTGSNAWKIPLAPAIAAATTSAVDGPIGVAINGVPIFNPCKQGGCQNGDTKVLGELDACNGHAGRADDYHYHAAPTCLMAGKPANYWDTHPLGWALDGFAIYGYNDAGGSTATRDSVCGGNTSTTPNGPAGYSYHVTDTSPYVLSCFRGTPSPDRVNQGSKFTPIRQPPVTPFRATVAAITLDAADGYQVMNFSTDQSFNTTTNGADNISNTAGNYNVRYKQLSGTVLSTALTGNPGKTACWNFKFTNSAGTETQPSTTYCR